MGEPKFDIKLLPDAVDFLDSLDEKSRDKILYNLKKAQHVVDNELLKNSMTQFGNSEHYTTAIPIGYSPFGIKSKIRTH